MPSVAKTSTSELEQLAGEGRDARRGSRPTAGLAPGLSSQSRAGQRAVRSAGRGRRPGWSRAATATVRGRVYRAPWHTPRRWSQPPSSRPSRPDHRPVPRGPVTLAPWEYLFESFNAVNFPDLFHPTWIAVARPAGRPRRPLQRPDARSSTAHRPYLDMWEWLWWTGPHHVRAAARRVRVFVFDFFLVLATEIDRPRRRWSGSGSSASRRSSRAYERAARAAALLHAAEVRATRRPRSDARGRGAAPARAAR